jgi:hypothetical protein
MASSLVVPIAVWHNLPNLQTTCLISRWPHVFAGQNDGSIWVFSLARTNDGNVQVIQHDDTNVLESVSRTSMITSRLHRVALIQVTALGP